MCYDCQDQMISKYIFEGKLYAVKGTSDCHGNSIITEFFPQPSMEFFFKGEGIWVKLNPPKGVTVQKAEKGSYRLEHLLKFVSTLKNQPVLLRHAQYKIYTLDDYSIHLCSKVKAALYKKG